MSVLFKQWWLIIQTYLQVIQFSLPNSDSTLPFPPPVPLLVEQPDINLNESFSLCPFRWTADWILSLVIVLLLITKDRLLLWCELMGINSTNSIFGRHRLHRASSASAKCASSVSSWCTSAAQSSTIKDLAWNKTIRCTIAFQEMFPQCVFLQQLVCLKFSFFKPFVTCCTRRHRTICLFYSKNKNSYVSFALLPVGNLDHTLVCLTTYNQLIQRSPPRRKFVRDWTPDSCTKLYWHYIWYCIKLYTFLRWLCNPMLIYKMIFK